jgi:hypothetical protein
MLTLYVRTSKDRINTRTVKEFVLKIYHLDLNSISKILDVC